ncbi:hypothetical protein [Luteolibacter marinus]|uniref:hypothetical protein n=1 Tax=Luteolibacter marinus TaxID=2776705 RepID=UPI0018673312|nr:hypothetical protein [Luteolibacter marinus]
MRGSPLLRTLSVLTVLLLAAFGLSRLTTGTDRPVVSSVEIPVETPSAERKIAYELSLSTTATEVTLDIGGSEVTASNTAETLSGSLAVEDPRPLVSLRIAWAGETPGHRFAKLRIEEPGKETREHVFSSAGDIDDIWEPEP